MTQAERHAQILDIVSQLTTIPLDELKPEFRLREDLGMDSVSSMELISMLTEEFDIDVDLEEAIAIADIKGVFDLADRYVED